MGIFDRFHKNNAVTVSSYKMIADAGSGFYSWNGNLYQSDIIRACIRPKARAIGKAVAKHVRRTGSKLDVNPDVYMRFLLEEPNPIMTGQQMQEKMAVQLELNNNAFAYIERNADGYPTAIYPITATSIEALQDLSGELFLRFFVVTGRMFTFRYSDLIHLRKDFSNNEIFGESPAQALTSLMEIVTTTDQGIIKAIQNSSIIRWLLKFNSSVRPEDLTKQAKEFAATFTSTEAITGGVAAVDGKFDAKQVDQKEYIPNALQMDKTTQRILSFFNTNAKVVQSDYGEDDWVSYYEAVVEPDLVQMANEYTRRLFSRRERGFGNKIVFESSSLTFASMATKLALVQFVDRAIMTPNEVRDVLGYAPYDGGDEMIRRLDTRPASEDKATAATKNRFTNYTRFKNVKAQTYAIDFDGTLCESMYPKIGYARQDVIDYVKQLKSDGNRIVLWTCRADELLDEAIAWCKENGIEFDAINENSEESIKLFGSDSRKIHADTYIDDKAINTADLRR